MARNSGRKRDIDEVHRLGRPDRIAPYTAGRGKQKVGRRHFNCCELLFGGECAVPLSPDSVGGGVSMKAWAVTTIALAAVVGIGLAMQPAVGQERTRTSNTGGTTAAAEDVKFIEKAASGGMHEVQLGQLASERANDPEVKKFGQMMVTDHSK